MRKLKKIFSAVLIVVCALFIVSCGLGDADTIKNSKVTAVNSQDINGQLKVHYIDVGQADSILIQQGNENMLIDAGNNDDEETLKSYLSNLGVTEFKYVIGTHPHEDHIGSMDYIMNSFKVGKIYFPKTNASTKTYENLVKAVKNKGMQFTEPKVGEAFNLGEAKCTILAPNSNNYDGFNNYSIVVKVEFGDNSFLFTGDAEEKSEKEMLAKGLDLKADVLKVGHHGSRTSTSTKFLDAVNPKYAVISCGKNNDYGHPHKETMEKLSKRNIQVYRTDESGTIVVTSNGKDITFNNFVSTEKAVEGNGKGQSSNLSQNNDSNKLNTNSNNVWISKNKTTVYHKDSTCSGLKEPKEITLEEAEKQGLKPCSKCAKS